RRPWRSRRRTGPPAPRAGPRGPAAPAPPTARRGAAARPAPAASPCVACGECSPATGPPTGKAACAASVEGPRQPVESRHGGSVVRVGGAGGAVVRLGLLELAQRLVSLAQAVEGLHVGGRSRAGGARVVALVYLDGLVERLDRLLGAAREHEHAAEVEERPRLARAHVGLGRPAAGQDVLGGGGALARQSAPLHGVLVLARAQEGVLQEAQRALRVALGGHEERVEL